MLYGSSMLYDMKKSRCTSFCAMSCCGVQDRAHLHLELVELGLVLILSHLPDDRLWDWGIHAIRHCLHAWCIVEIQMRCRT